MTFCFYVKVKVGKLLANLVSMLVPDREMRHRVRRRLDPLSPERCVAYLERHYTDVEAIDEYDGETLQHAIWVCWLQGIEQAPELVQRCVASVEQYKRPEQQVIILTAQNFSEYVTLPDVMVDKWRRGLITNTHFSDLLRIYALARHGGLWMDATCLLLAPLPEEVTAGPLYIMRSHGEFDYTVIQSCLMASDRNGYVMRKWCAAMDAYWQHENGLVNYFTLHLMFVALLHRDERFAADFARVPVVSDEKMHVLLDALSQGKPLTAQLMDEARQASFVQKLTYKKPLNL